uniref:Putative secreted protein n=1 Tax=Anopheles darlingi TaxID=43151 RepID=A0A2M4DEM6_ANODA
MLLLQLFFIFTKTHPKTISMTLQIVFSTTRWYHCMAMIVKQCHRLNLFLNINTLMGTTECVHLSVYVFIVAH